MQKKFSLFVCALMAVVLGAMPHSGAKAATLRFDVWFSGGGTGWIEIDSAFVLPDAQIPTDRAQVAFTLGGLTFSRSQAGSTAFFRIDSSGTQIAALESPGPGRVLPFAVSARMTPTVALSESAVPGTFVTQGLPGGDISGHFTIAAAVRVVPMVAPVPAPVPLPGSGWILFGGLWALVLFRTLRGIAPLRGGCAAAG